MSDVETELDVAQPARPHQSAAGAPARAVSRWLWLLWFCVWAMVVVGGLTRLTGSGLSMVEWHPLMGALPPITDQDWQDVFARYQQSPQYQLVNHWMSVEDFKRIFLWEYGHRLLGRLLGAVFAVPFLYFVVRGYLRGVELLRVGVAFVLGGAQGLLGWYMVKSGLIDRPEVSHLRLAAHLSLAFTVGMYLLWQALGFGDRASDLSAGLRQNTVVMRPIAPLWAVGMLISLLSLQIVYGAFMAGTHAGLLFATFPDMNGSWLPGAFFKFPTLAGDLLRNPMAIHWIHRMLGWLVAVLVVVVVFLVFRRCSAREVRVPGIALILVTALQIGLGAWTVLAAVPVAVATAHQACAYALLSCAFWLAYRLGHVAGAMGELRALMGRPVMMQV